MIEDGPAPRSIAARAAHARPAVGRVRGPRVTDAVLDATLGLIAERAYSFSVEDVAIRSHVHKTTIYRRYDTKAALVGAALERLSANWTRVEESPDPLEDLVALAQSVARALSGPAGAHVMRAALAAASEDARVVTLARRLLAGRFDVATQILGRAVVSGQLRAGTDPVLLWAAIVNPLQLRALLGHPVNEVTARDLVVLALDGASSRTA